MRNPGLFLASPEGPAWLGSWFCFNGRPQKCQAVHHRESPRAAHSILLAWQPSGWEQRLSTPRRGEATEAQMVERPPWMARGCFGVWAAPCSLPWSVLGGIWAPYLSQGPLRYLGGFGIEHSKWVFCSSHSSFWATEQQSLESQWNWALEECSVGLTANWPNLDHASCCIRAMGRGPWCNHPPLSMHTCADTWMCTYMCVHMPTYFLKKEYFYFKKKMGIRQLVEKIILLIPLFGLKLE